MKTICIMCPIGCELNITKTTKDIKVTGNACIRGQDYGVTEYTNPKRMITTIIPYPKHGGTISLKTSESVDKNLITDILKIISRTTPPSKVKPGDIFIKNVLDTGVNILVTCINKGV